MQNIPIIDDQEKLRAILARIIGLEVFEVIQAKSCKSRLSRLSKKDQEPNFGFKTA